MARSKGAAARAQAERTSGRSVLASGAPAWHSGSKSERGHHGGATADRHSMATLIIQVGGATGAAGPAESIRNITTRLAPDEKANDFGVL